MKCFTIIERNEKFQGVNRDQDSFRAQSRDDSRLGQQSSGIHYWNVQTDTVYSDEAASQLFGFSEMEGKQGLPLKSYLDRIYKGDLPRVAAAIHDAMITGRPYHEEYRTISPQGVVNVIAIGRWFRDAQGDPSHYSGILFKRAEPLETPASLEALCLIAHDRAKAEGQTAVAEKIIDALACLDRAPFKTHQ